jgi:predicted PurR-regulated permease PerM
MTKKNAELASAGSGTGERVHPAARDGEGGAAERVGVWFLGFLSVVCAAFILYLMRGILFPLTLAVFIALAFKPLVERMQRKGVPTVVVIVAVLLCVTAMFSLFGLVLVSAVQSFVSDAPAYQQKFNSAGVSSLEWLNEKAARLGIQISADRVQQELNLSSLVSSLASIVGSLVSFLGDLAMTLLFLIFLLAGGMGFPGKIRRAFDASTSESIAAVLASVERGVRRYILAQTVISLATGVATALILLIFGVDFALLFGLLAFLLNYIPNVGSVLASLLPVLVAFLQFGSAGTAAGVAVSLIVAQNLLGNIVSPRVMGQSLDLSPLTILISLIFWGWLWGVWGMFIAVPLATITRIVCGHIGPLRPVAVLMGMGATRTTERA